MDPFFWIVLESTVSWQKNECGMFPTTLSRWSWSSDPPHLNYEEADQRQYYCRRKWALLPYEKIKVVDFRYISDNWSSSVLLHWTSNKTSLFCCTSLNELELDLQCFVVTWKTLFLALIATVGWLLHLISGWTP